MKYKIEFGSIGAWHQKTMPYKSTAQTQPAFNCYIRVKDSLAMSARRSSKNTKRPIKAVPTAKNAERERSRVRSLRSAFQTLQSCLPSVPPDTKLSKLDILILATNYIAQLMATLEENTDISFRTIPDLVVHRRSMGYVKYYHPIKVVSIIEISCNN